MLDVWSGRSRGRLGGFALVYGFVTRPRAGADGVVDEAFAGPAATGQTDALTAR